MNSYFRVSDPAALVGRGPAPRSRRPESDAGRFGMRPRPDGRVQSGVRSRRVRDSF